MCTLCSYTTQVKNGLFIFLYGFATLGEYELPYNYIFQKTDVKALFLHLNSLILTLFKIRQNMTPNDPL